ncbi:unnamed protein product [Mytilus coruscus]|uniref:Uncharacterized protein n=1 Tax=Mytilus coruscus TaxID=42192 RepID=A0A6J8BRF0_MYTCO|nr:unnamed protein product [Mytilus coruscus]
MSFLLIEKSAYHSHKQLISVFMKDIENQEHHRDLTSGIPANVGIIANAQLQFTSKHITDGSTYEQLPVVSTKYAECKNHFSNIESESDIKDSEDHTSNQEISSDLFQRAASAVGACDDHFSNIESESDIKDSEDHTSNQQISSDLFQRAASAVGACDEQFSDIESESDIKDSEDHKSNQQIPSDLFQRATSAVGACDGMYKQSVNKYTEI